MVLPLGIKGVSEAALALQWKQRELKRHSGKLQHDKKVSFKTYLLFICLFYLFLAASGLSCGMWDLSFWRGSFSLVVTCGFQGAWAL